MNHDILPDPTALYPLPVLTQIVVPTTEISEPSPQRSSKRSKDTTTKPTARNNHMDDSYYAMSATAEYVQDEDGETYAS